MMVDGGYFAKLHGSSHFLHGMVGNHSCLYLTVKKNIFYKIDMHRIKMALFNKRGQLLRNIRGAEFLAVYTAKLTGAAILLYSEELIRRSKFRVITEHRADLGVAGIIFPDF